MTSLSGWLLHRLWYVHPDVRLTIQAAPGDCLRAIADAAKPSLNRLHLRNLFADGRRYYLDPLKDGFWMTSNSKIPWRRRARTGFAAVLYAEFSPLSEGATLIHLRARMRILFFLDIFLIPLFISSILIFAPWPRSVIGSLSIALFGLSWVWHRLTAALQATDMVYFVQKALEDIPAAKIPKLAPPAPEVITPNREFREQWQKFYQQHQDET